ncbi:hypothetical protein G5V59_23205 [Nocardioides sp. W3-2-3]|nr:hypothetical protein [Nocardioides convexus]
MVVERRTPAQDGGEQAGGTRRQPRQAEDPAGFLEPARCRCGPAPTPRPGRRTPRPSPGGRR